MLHCIADRFALAPPLTSAVAMTDAGQAVFRIKTEPLVPLLVIGGKPGFVANEGGVALDQVNPPPAGIAAEEGDVSALFHKRLNVAPHRLAPVFVMTGAEEERIGSESIAKVFMYIEVGAVVDRTAFAFEPANKRHIPMPEGLSRRCPIISIREVVIPWPAADAPARAMQRQLVIARGIKAAAGIAEFVVGVRCEQRQLIQYFCSYLTGLDNEQGRCLRMAGLGHVARVLIERDKPRDIRSRFPLARDRIFIEGPVPIAIWSSQRPGISEHRFRLRLEGEMLPLPEETNSKPQRRIIARDVKPQYLARQDARLVRVTADHAIRPRRAA